MVAARGLDDECVHPGFREMRAAREALVVEIHVAGVENGLSFRADQRPGRAEHVAGVEKLQRDFVGIRLAVDPLAFEVEPLVERAAAPAFFAEIHLAMREKRVVHDARVLALAAHDVDGVVQHHARQQPRRLGHENRSARVAAHEQRQRADVIVMRMREHDGVHGTIGEPGEIGDGLLALLLRVHPGIEHHGFAAGELEGVAIGADLDAAGEVGKEHGCV